MALKRGNTRFTLSALKDLVAKEFDKLTPAVWAKYEDHAIKREDFYRGLAASRDEVEGDLEEKERDWGRHSRTTRSNQTRSSLMRKARGPLKRARLG